MKVSGGEARGGGKGAALSRGGHGDEARHRRPCPAARRGALPRPLTAACAAPGARRSARAAPLLPSSPPAAAALAPKFLVSRLLGGGRRHPAPSVPVTGLCGASLAAGCRKQARGRPSRGAAGRAGAAGRSGAERAAAGSGERGLCCGTGPPAGNRSTGVCLAPLETVCFGFFLLSLLLFFFSFFLFFNVTPPTASTACLPV